MMNDVDSRVAERLVGLVQIIFAFVLAQSLGRYDSIVLDPLSDAHRFQAAALIGVYLTTVLSWIDWHIVIVLRPYNFSAESGRRLSEELRLFADLFIVSVYAYLLLGIAHLGRADDADLSKYLAGYVGVYAGYFVSGLLRRITYGRQASALTPIAVFVGLNALVLVSYELLADNHSPRWTWPYVAAPVALLALYRYARHRLRRGVLPGDDDADAADDASESPGPTSTGAGP